MSDLFTAEEAAAEVGVEAATIYTWKARGFIEPAGKRGRYLLYRLSDVFACEASRQRKHRRKVRVLMWILGSAAGLASGLLSRLGDSLDGVMDLWIM
ncbi:helix-turn-helix domain-containing protein [Microtetraspora malaysiensis]|uniref:helix-turn-helix domain-containing protein n=1 Tax=Microtetraspora malaysiensis TaxID=161358 RepID=UPI003D8C7463